MKNLFYLSPNVSIPQVLCWQLDHLRYSHLQICKVKNVFLNCSCAIPSSSVDCPEKCFIPKSDLPILAPSFVPIDSPSSAPPTAGSPTGTYIDLPTLAPSFAPTNLPSLAPTTAGSPTGTSSMLSWGVAGIAALTMYVLFRKGREGFKGITTLLGFPMGYVEHQEPNFISELELQEPLCFSELELRNSKPFLPLQPSA